MTERCDNCTNGGEAPIIVKHAELEINDRNNCQIVKQTWFDGHLVNTAVSVQQLSRLELPEWKMCCLNPCTDTAVTS